MKQDRKFELLLYPDASNYDFNEVILKAQSYFDYWAFIIHDLDVGEDGEPKKTHCHFYGKKDSTVTPSGICFHLGLPETSLRNIKSWKGAIRYLIHADNPEKAQYSIDAVTSNFNLTPFFELKEDDTAQALKIFDFITTYRPTLEQTVSYVLANNLWSAFRRGFAVWSKIINERGSYYESNRHS